MQYWDTTKLSILSKVLSGIDEEEISKSLNIPLENLKSIITEKKFVERLESEQSKIFLAVRSEVIERIRNFLKFLDSEIQRLYKDSNRDSLLIVMIREYSRILTSIIGPQEKSNSSSKKSKSIKELDISEAKKQLGYEEPTIADF